MVETVNKRLRQAFGAHVRCEGPLASSGSGLRVTGVDLRTPLRPDEVNALLDALGQYRIVTLGGQHLESFSVAHFERFANHWGAPLPHPSNFKRPALERFMDNPELLPTEERPSSRVNAAFPGKLRCLPGADSPAVLVVANMHGLSDTEREAGPRVTRGTTWHTDIEHQPIPLHVSMFLVHKVPVSRSAPGGTWVPDPRFEKAPNDPYFEDADPRLMRLRRALPKNGETSFADTAAAFLALPRAERTRLSSIRVRRHSYTRNEADPVPLVRTNPRSGIQSLHSPLWCPRPPRQIPVEVDGMSVAASRAFLDEIEAHVLQPEFRYDHAHTPGDVTIWDLYTTIHVAPPIKENIQSIDDARLFYRISCKGEPALTLPRRDPPEWIEEHIFLGYTTPPEVIEVC
ncbi:MAG: TauD/TfdA family dioxygenase [Gammaproteobacteria bacterium]|nr:TauD/TfdA family dioxygenase [Gammaproteobacteria bacterium]